MLQPIQRFVKFMLLPSPATSHSYFVVNRFNSWTWMTTLLLFSCPSQHKARSNNLLGPADLYHGIIISQQTDYLSLRKIQPWFQEFQRNWSVQVWSGLCWFYVSRAICPKLYVACWVFTCSRGTATNVSAAVSDLRERLCIMCKDGTAATLLII